ncbi:MAG: anaerobic ribonucleoside-triphosphate reductase, partial [Promethearchaeota archaeon]
MNLLPKVFKKGDVDEFEPSKIMESIIQETGVDEENARKITELVVRRIISSNMKFLSGPHIREIVCSILSENQYEQERKLYTRIGMPLMDYEKILEVSQKDSSEKNINPEKIHHWAANQLAEEYTLLRILNDEESKAHLYGDLYIHQLKYFDLRPYNQYWDPRLVLEHGLPPIKNYTHACKSNPAKNLKEAVDHLANWLGMVQTEFSGNQGLELITVFLAPYIQGLNDNEIKEIMKRFIYSINYLSTSSGKNYLKSSLACSPGILSSLLDVPAIGPGGIEVGHYDSYKKESKKLFDIITQIYTEGDDNNCYFPYPEHLIYYNEGWLIRFEEQYESICKEVLKNQSSCFINIDRHKILNKMIQTAPDSYLNHGVLQKISLNLPRYAFLSQDETKFLELLKTNLKICFEILDKKHAIIGQRLKTGHLPLCSGYLDDHQLFDLENQELCVGFIGLNEAVKILTNFELHETDTGLLLGKKIVKKIHDFCEERSKNEGKHYSLINASSKGAIRRFLRLDSKHFPNLALKNYQKSSHFRIIANLEDKIKKQGEFHPWILNDARVEISLRNHEENLKSQKDLLRILNYSCTNTEISSLKYLP